MAKMNYEARKALNAARDEANVQAVKDGMPQEIRRADLLAEIRRVHYDASIRKGFTPEQALVLCSKAVSM